MVGDDPTLSSNRRRRQGECRRPAVQLMSVDHVGAAQGTYEPGAHGMGRVTTCETARPQHENLQPVPLVGTVGGPEGHQPARHFASQGPGQLERVPFASPEEPIATEQRRRYVRHRHAASLTDHAG